MMLTTQRNYDCSRPKKSFFIKDILHDDEAESSSRTRLFEGSGCRQLAADTGRYGMSTSSLIAGKQKQQHSPLDQLMQLTKSTLQGLNCDIKSTDAESSLLSSLWVGKAGCLRRRRKTRTAFTARQLAALEERFKVQRYLTPASRDELASALGLSNAQVITWFQNRRAKLKRESEEQRRDVMATSVIREFDEESEGSGDLDQRQQSKDEDEEMNDAKKALSQPGTISGLEPISPDSDDISIDVVSEDANNNSTQETEHGEGKEATSIATTGLSENHFRKRKLLDRDTQLLV